MNAGALPAALLCAALGLVLAFAPRRRLVAGVSALMATALLLTRFPLDAGWSGAILLGCWISVLLTAAIVYVADRLTWWGALLLSMNAGCWSGAVIAAGEGGWSELATALPWALLSLPGGWLVARKGATALKVLASWLAAVAILAAVLPMVTTPGYAPDHME